MDKQKQIEEIARIYRDNAEQPKGYCLFPDSVNCVKTCKNRTLDIPCKYMRVAKAIYEQGYRNCKTNNEKILFPLGNGNLILKGYETEKDLKKASEDIKRALRVLADMSIYEIMKELAPYRLEAAKHCQQEYNDITEGLKE